MAMNEPSGMGASGASVEDLDGLLETLQGGVASLSPDAALSAIQTWQMQVQALPDPNAQIVAGDLGQLYDALGSEGGMAEGTSIGGLLSTLANDIRVLIDTSTDVPGLGDKLSQLATALESEGMALSGDGA